METDTLKKFVLPVPPTDEQRLIVGQLKAAITRLDHLAEQAARTVTCLTEYRSALITAATTGQIDVRGIQLPSAT